MTNRIFGYALTLAVGLGTGAAVSTNASANTFASANSAVQQGTDAAFRDGIFQGKHDAEEGRLRHVSTGRWATETNRSQFQAGYDAGFSNTTK
jgi:hypothetical protein